MPYSKSRDLWTIKVGVQTALYSCGSEESEIKRNLYGCKYVTARCSLPLCVIFLCVAVNFATFHMFFLLLALGILFYRILHLNQDAVMLWVASLEPTATFQPVSVASTRYSNIADIFLNLIFLLKQEQNCGQKTTIVQGVPLYFSYKLTKHNGTLYSATSSYK